MHHELWSVDTANMSLSAEAEAEILALVRELLAKGWDADNPVLIYDDEALPVEALPSAVSGAELARRAEEAAPRRRTA